MKESMEVTEVLAPQFVVPVAAVVLCALLVFMFGFTHAPEPTFDYESSDDKKTKKTKGKKKSEKVVQSNGHVVNIEPAKPVSVSSQSAKPTSEKKETTKQKKKAPVKVLKQDTEVETAEEDDGGWTTAVSKKEKKKKRFDEDAIQQISKDEYATSNSELDDEPPVKPVSAAKSTATAQPQDQRPSKKSKKTKTTQQKNPEQGQKDGNKEDILNEEVKDTETTENKPEVVVSKEVEENIIKTTNVKSETPKKNKKKKKKNDGEVMTEQEPETDVIDSKISELQKVAETRSIEVEIADAMRETSNVIQAEPETVKIESKSTPKNKKKQKGASKKETDVRVSQVTSSQVLNSSHTVTNTRSDVGHSSSAELEKVSPVREMQVKNANSKKKGESLESNSKAAPAAAAATATAVTTDTPSAKNTEAGGDTKPATAISFDELGEDEWQEAKPVKKRKKPRRDN